MTKRKLEIAQEMLKENEPFRRCEFHYRDLCYYSDCFACYLHSFASHQKAAFWNYNKNVSIPREVRRASNKKFWFNCNLCDHDFESALNNITQLGRWCPYCASKKLCSDSGCGVCYHKSFASFAKAEYWNYSKNTYTPREITLASALKCWFSCNLCEHDFESHVYSVKEGVWCLYCSTSCQKLCTDSACAACYNRSFASCEKRDWWDYTANSVTPREITKNTNNIYYFNCLSCGHDFVSAGNQMHARGDCCSYCRLSAARLCDSCDCTLCFDRSFQSHSRSSAWHKTKNGSITPRMICKGDNNVYWFSCTQCDHDFDTRVSSITSGNTWCPYCCHLKFCDNLRCTRCETNSFANHPRAAFWDYSNNAVTPRYAAPHSDLLYAFNCEKGHKFKMSLNNITYRGSWCSHCINKTQNMVAEFLGEHFSVKTESSFEWCKNSNGNLCKYDIEVAEKNCLIEVDGPQHFLDMPHWHSVATTVLENDIFKMKAAVANNMRVVRICQSDVWGNVFEWKTLLLDAVNNSSKLVDFISNAANLYNSHRST